jgi:hypothetical protein
LQDIVNGDVFLLPPQLEQSGNGGIFFFDLKQ